jgi:hypothetical protein
VIWSVTRVSNVAGDHTQDEVIVVLSEPFLDGAGNPFPLTTKPADLFHVWIKTGSAITPGDSIFEGIQNFRFVKDDTLKFNMTNGEELTGNHLLSLDTTAHLLSDLKQNPVTPENQQVRVKVIGAIGLVEVGPNPITPRMDHFENELTAHEPSEVAQWARVGGGMFATKLVLSSDMNLPVTGQMMIFDQVGNMVYSRKNNNDLIPSWWRSSDEWITGETRDLVFYWNGVNDRNTKAAPGIYRVIVFLKCGVLTSKFTGNVGISR